MKQMTGHKNEAKNSNGKHDKTVENETLNYTIMIEYTK